MLPLYGMDMYDRRRHGYGMGTTFVHFKNDMSWVSWNLKPILYDKSLKHRTFYQISTLLNDLSLRWPFLEYHLL